MLLNFIGRVWDFQTIKRGFFTSKHSLKQLERLEIRIPLTNDDSEELLRLINTVGNRDLTSVDDTGNVLKHWKIKNNSYSYNDRSLYVTHDIEIVEDELLQPTFLQIDELVIETTNYLEYFNGEQLTIRAVSEIMIDQQAIIKNLLFKEVSVIRYGIDENPRRMTLLNGLWSEANDIIKHQIYLVEVNKVADDNSLWTDDRFPLIYHASIQSAENQALLNVLLSTLVDKQVLNSDELNKIYEEADKQRKEIIYNFYRVEDLNF